MHALFFLSGVAALTLEITWMGVLGRTFGTTAESASATLAAFFLGLGAGAAVFGRLAGRIRRPLRAYGLLEVAVGIAAGASLWVFAWGDAAYGALLPAASRGAAWAVAVRLGLALALIGPAAFFMGGTLPVLVEHVVRVRGDLGRRGSLLYGLNTLGAAAGGLIATFVLPWALGWRGTGAAAAGLAAVVGLAAVGLSASSPGRRRIRRSGGEGGAAPRALAGLAFASGALSLALQVLWTRLFAQALPGSIYVFGTVVVVYLVSLGLGALVVRRLASRLGAAASVLPALLALSALLVAATMPAFLLWTGGLSPPAPGQAFGAYLLYVVAGAALLLVAPVTALGAVFPWLLHLAGRAGAAPGRAAGALAAWNTAGALAGSILAGFVTLRALGLSTSIGVAAGAYAALAVLQSLRARRASLLVASVLAAAGAGLALARSAPPVRLNAGERLLAVWEGPGATVSVLGDGGHRRLVVDNVFSLGGTHEGRWEAYQAHIPLCIHPKARRVFFLGLGTGITAGAGLDHDVEHLVAAEIVPEVIEAARAYFAPWSNGLFEDARAVVLADDARHHLRWTDASYDVVVGDLFFPWEPGTANLYTREHFRAVRGRLAPGGLFAQWLPCYQLAEKEFLGIARTMRDVFPLVTLWRGDFFADRPILALVGHREPSALDPDAMLRSVRALAASGGDDLARDAESVPFHLYAGNLTVGAALTSDGRLVPDDRPWIARTAPRSERQRQDDPRALFVGRRLLAFETALRTAVPAGRDPYLARLDDRERRLVDAGVLLRRLAVEIAAHDRAAHARALLAYVRAVPHRLRADLDRWIE